MAGLFSQETIDEIRSRVDIADLISEYVSLRKQGNSFVARCPFHDDKTPSFHVTPENGLFYCFGCGVGGDLFSFVMKIDHLDFPQAVEKLALRAGVPLVREGVSSAPPEKLEKLNRLREINREAAFYYYQCLRSEEGVPFRRYLEERQIDRESQRQFALGYAPGNNALQSYLATKGITVEEMLAAGLVIKRDDGSVIDRFRDRVMFPITDHRGRVVGFGGRLITPGEPKYLNTPETEVFRKKSLLYGLHLALPAIRQEKVAILVEGYLDVIALHQYGIKNAVASLGTAFTPEHAKLLKRYANEVILLFDNDEAGIKATERAIESFGQQHLKIKIASLAGAKDPDEFLKTYGTQAFLKQLAKALPVILYRFELLKSQMSLETPGNKSALLRELFPEIARLTSQVERQEYIKILAQELNLSEEVIWDDFRRNQGEQRGKYQYLRDKTSQIRNNTSGNGNVNSFRTPYVIAQENMLRLLLQNPSLVKRVSRELGQEVFNYELYRELFILIEELVDTKQEEPVTVRDIIFYAPENLKSVIARLSSTNPLPVGERQIQDTMTSLQLQHLSTQVANKRKEIREAEAKKDFPGVQILLQEITDLQRKIQSLK